MEVKIIHVRLFRLYILSKTNKRNGDAEMEVKIIRLYGLYTFDLDLSHENLCPLCHHCFLQCFPQNSQESNIG